MLRKLLALSTLVVLATAANAQAPKGFKLRIDRSTSASDPDAAGTVKVAQMSPGFHVTAPQAAVIWSPDSVAKGAFTLKGTFHLMTPSNHTNYYGLVFGGGDLDGPKQNYMYFLIAQDGTWLIKHRANDTEIHEIVKKTPSEAIRKPSEPGKSTPNDLEVRVTKDRIDYVVNGTVVHTMKAADGHFPNADGLYGVRINHMLDVHVEKFGAAR